MTPSSDSIQPPGGRRAAQRQHTRSLMLQVVLDIIVSDGMRAVRHRVVAERAGVALGTTTYHFSSIEDLIVSAFQFWRAKRKLTENPYYKKMVGLLEPYEQAGVPESERCRIAEQVYRYSVEYIVDQLSGRREDRIVELAFYHESLRSEALRELVLESWQMELDYMVYVHRLLGSASPDNDARITLSVFRHLEHSATIADLPRLDMDVIKGTLHRHMGLSFNVSFAL